jgi:hypothetical protein
MNFYLLDTSLSLKVYWAQVVLSTALKASTQNNLCCNFAMCSTDFWLPKPNVFHSIVYFKQDQKTEQWLTL